MADRKVSYSKIHDTEWLRETFMVSHAIEADQDPEKVREDINFRIRVFSTAAFKYADTSLGGNLVINPLPQFTKFADPPVQGLFNIGKNEDEAGMGDFYSRAFDDNKRYISMSFGVAQFNSLTSFYKGFYNSEFSTLARTGRAPSVFYQAGKATGFVVGLLSPWLVLYSVGSAFARWAAFNKSSKYYFFKPTMANYWSAVQMLANDIAVKTQFVTRANPAGFFNDPVGSGGDTRQNLSASDIAQINDGIGDMMDSYDPETGESNGINVYAVATRYQRMQRAAFKALQNHYDGVTSPDEFGATLDEEGNVIIDLIGKAIKADSYKQPKRSFAQYLNEWTSSGAPGAMPNKNNPADTSVRWFDDPNAAPSDQSKVSAGESDIITEKSITQGDDAAISSWWKFLQAELDDGAQYVSFRVEPTGDARESFSNNVGVPSIATSINGKSGDARQTRFSMAEGNIGDGALASFVEAGVGAAKEFLAGAADQLGLSGLGVLGGNAFADIPKYWTDSSSDMPGMSYRIRLSSPYGNKYSRFVNIWLPFTMILVGALPLSTGPHSYTSPFLCQLYDRGRAQTRLGMITSMSVTRGLNNLAFNHIGEPMAIEINFTVSELSSIVHMPIRSGFRPIGDLLESVFEQESLFNDYVATLSSLSLAEQIYVGERIKLGLTKYLKQLDSYWSVPHAMNALGDLAPMRLASMFFNGIANR